MQTKANFVPRTHFQLFIISFLLVEFNFFLTIMNSSSMHMFSQLFIRSLEVVEEASGRHQAVVWHLLFPCQLTKSCHQIFFNNLLILALLSKNSIFAFLPLFKYSFPGCILIDCLQKHTWPERILRSKSSKQRTLQCILISGTY